jgi:hypothetical protein
LVICTVIETVFDIASPEVPPTPPVGDDTSGERQMRYAGKIAGLAG